MCGSKFTGFESHIEEEQDAGWMGCVRECVWVSCVCFYPCDTKMQMCVRYVCSVLLCKKKSEQNMEGREGVLSHLQ